MNVLLIGGTGSLMNRLIIKLKKEGHRVYLLTGSRYKKRGYEKVFEEYHFSYDSDCMLDILESIRPKVTVFLGAYDTNFTWVDAAKDSVKYTASLSNILSSFAMGEFGRFFYLSSHEVFSGNYPEDITEETATSADSYRGMAVAQGELICSNYQTGRKLDIVTLRLDHLCLIPKNARESGGICADMCLSALKNGQIAANRSHVISVLYETDAVEYIYRMIAIPSHSHNLYHISSSEEISELELAKAIKAAADVGVVIQEKDDWSAREILSGERFSEEFGKPEFHHPKEFAGKMMAYMEKNKRIYLEDASERKTLRERLLQKTGWFIRAMLPFAENMACFIPFFMLNNRAVGSAYFSGLDFYLLYVLLFAIIYGQQQAIFSAVLSVAGYLFRQMYHRTGFEVMMDYNTYVWITQLFIVGLLVGYMRDQIRALKSESEEEQEFLNYRLGDMTDINHSNVRVKDALETEIINHNDSVGKVYNITSRLDRYSPEEVLFYAVETVAQLMNTKDVAIYSISNHDYARLAAATSEKARMYGRSIRYRQMQELSRELLEKHVYINRAIDKSYPNMASAIWDGEDIQLIIMVWGTQWEQMTLGQANLLTIVGALIQNAVLRANRYLNALEDKRHVDGNRVLETSAFVSMVKACYQAMDKGLTECALILVEADNTDSYRKAGDDLTPRLRHSDYLGTMEDNKLYALLTNTDRGTAQKVISRFEESGYMASFVEEFTL